MMAELSQQDVERLREYLRTINEWRAKIVEEIESANTISEKALEVATANKEHLALLNGQVAKNTAARELTEKNVAVIDEWRRISEKSADRSESRQWDQARQLAGVIAQVGTLIAVLWLVLGK